MPLGIAKCDPTAKQNVITLLVSVDSQGLAGQDLGLSCG
jgi:hypothetical protein